MTAELLLNLGNLFLSQKRKTKKNLNVYIFTQQHIFFLQGDIFQSVPTKTGFVAQKQKKENILIINLYNILLFMFTT